MRISDWSSDVCSSDLGARTVQHALTVGTALLSGARQREVGRARTPRHGGVRTLKIALHEVPLWLPPVPSAGDAADGTDATGGDRKSVVKGKRVSVRVDLGGRRIIKKKNN